MSELKVYHCNEWHNEYTEFYIKSEVDAAIDQLKREHHRERHEYIDMVAQLKAKLEDDNALLRKNNDELRDEIKRLKEEKRC